MTAVAPQAAAAPLFSPGTDFEVGERPYSVTSADFDGDGDPDLAVVNNGADTVSVLLGTGSGGFGPKTDFNVGKHPSSVTSADFDGDGNPDLAVANWRSNSVSVLLGSGSGGFGPKTDFKVGDPNSVTSADFDGDGDPDLAVANYSDRVSVLLGTGSGGFGPRTNFNVGRYNASVTSADFDGDGNPDLATANMGKYTGRRPDDSSVSVLLGTGSGGFGTRTDFTVGSAPTSVTSADFDGDGDPDLATANDSYPDDSVSVLLGTGSGGFGPRTDFTVGRAPASVTSADFDGDGNPDLATANTGDDSVWVLLGTGAPNTTITKKPKGKIKTKTKSVKVTVKFTSEDAGSTFKCKLDKASYKPCTSPYKVKAESKPGKGMKHKISIKAKDGEGNVGKPATVKFKVIRKG